MEFKLLPHLSTFRALRRVGQPEFIILLCNAKSVLVPYKSLHSLTEGMGICQDEIAGFCKRNKDGETIILIRIN